jgi:hypothetical protein
MIGELADPVDERMRSEAAAAHQHPDLGGMVREKHRRLTCRVAAPTKTTSCSARSRASVRIK